MAQFTAAAKRYSNRHGPQHAAAITWLVRLILILLLCWSLFAFLFWTPLGTPVQPRHWLAASLGGAMVTTLQQLAAVVFGPMIVGMVLFQPAGDDCASLLSLGWRTQR